MAATFAILTVLAALVPVLIAVLKAIALSTDNVELQRKLATTEKIAVAAGEAINRVTPLLGVENAKALKLEVNAGAARRGVVSELEDLVKRHGLNATSTDALAGGAG